MEISSKSVRKSSFRLSTKNAWAKYVRNRWPNNALKGCMAEWGLTEGKARGLVYAQATQATIDEVLEAEDRRRPFGAFALGMVILAIKTDTELAEYITYQAGEAAHEAAKWQAEERSLAALQASVARLHRLDGRADQSARAGGTNPPPLGSDRDDEALDRQRSFSPRNRD